MAARTRVTGLADAQTRLRKYERAVEAAYLAAMEAGAERIQEWERANRRWQDHTGDARDGLECIAVKVLEGITLLNSHGVDYGKYLEFDHERKYAILREAIRRHWFGILRDAAARQKALGQA